MQARSVITVTGVLAVFIMILYIAYPQYGNQMYPSFLTGSAGGPNRASYIYANDFQKKTFLSVSQLYRTDKVTIHHYEILYEKYLREYVGSNVYILEIGLGCGMPYGPGASAYVWRHYLGPLANIHFLEFDRTCGEAWYKAHGQKLNVTMFYGSQDDVDVLNTITSKRGYFDVIIDDGGHTMTQQITSFIHLLPKVQSGGTYVIEDLLTSYMPTTGGGYLKNSTTIELIKRLVDDIQTISPHKSTNLVNKIRSFEIADEICFFTIK